MRCQTPQVLDCDVVQGHPSLNDRIKTVDAMADVSGRGDCRQILENSGFSTLVTGSPVRKGRIYRNPAYRTVELVEEPPVLAPRAPNLNCRSQFALGLTPIRLNFVLEREAELTMIHVVPV